VSTGGAPADSDRLRLLPPPATEPRLNGGSGVRPGWGFSGVTADRVRTEPQVGSYVPACLSLEKHDRDTSASGKPRASLGPRTCNLGQAATGDNASALCRRNLKYRQRAIQTQTLPTPASRWMGTTLRARVPADLHLAAHHMCMSAERLSPTVGVCPVNVVPCRQRRVPRLGPRCSGQPSTWYWCSQISKRSRLPFTRSSFSSIRRSYWSAASTVKV
jgi:hypothetical protein